MLLSIFAVRDRAVDTYGRPFYLASKGQALRSFQDEVNRSDKDNMMFYHPDDFELFYIGQFDDVTAAFDLLKHPESLGSAKQFKLA